MPTLEQLNKCWELEFQLFGCDPKINGYPKPSNDNKFTGPVFGKVVYDPITNELDIIID